MSIKVYSRLRGKLASWEVGTHHHAVAIITAASSLRGNKVVSQGRWKSGTFLAVIPGGKAVRAEVAA